MIFPKFRSKTFQLKVAIVKSCWVLTLTVNLILIVVLTIYTVRQVKKVNSSCKNYTLKDIREKKWSFLNPQFKYSLYIWMPHSHNNDNKIKYLHKIYLRLIYSDKKSLYSNLLETNNLVSVHHKNIKALAIEMFKVKHKLFQKVTTDIFIERINNQYNLRNRTDFITPKGKSVYHGTESFTYLKTWDIVPEEIKQTNSLVCYNVGTNILSCRLSKVYLDAVGFH